MRTAYYIIIPTPALAILAVLYRVFLLYSNFASSSFLLLYYRYDLTIEPDLEAFTFQGRVDISLDKNNNNASSSSSSSSPNNNSITLHAKELAFQTAYIVAKDGTKTVVEEIRMNIKATTVEFVFAQALPTQTFVLTIEYVGLLNNQMCGFYRSQYTDIHGNKKIMASTQFESLDARRAFPCVDEPAAKAVFGLTLIVHSTLDCFSNMPESKKVTVGASGGQGVVKKSISFMDTPRMSTYLLAFCVGEFDCVQAQSAHGVLVKVYTPPGKSESGVFALDCATKALDSYDDFFEVPYPLPKLDMVRVQTFW